MEKRKIALAMLGILFLQTVSVPVNAFGEANAKHSTDPDVIIDQAGAIEDLLGSTVPANESGKIQATVSSQETEQPALTSETASDEEQDRVQIQAPVT